MKKITLVLMVLISVLVSVSAVLVCQQQDISDKLIRLHVVANSDGAADQRRKLIVRDAILSELKDWEIKSRADAEQTLAERLPELCGTAERTLRAEGCADAVTVTLQNEIFPTKKYESFSLPAGIYTTLRVRIGAGEGHNWWCVVYPAICLCATTDEFTRTAEAAGFSNREIRLITEDSGGYVLKFKAMEILEDLREKLLDN